MARSKSSHRWMQRHVNDEYVKRSNRETGPALVGIELGDPADLHGLLDRMLNSRIGVERIPPDSPFYRFAV